MFPGLTTKLSESDLAMGDTIYPKTDIVNITDTTSTTMCIKISPNFGGGFSGMLFIINRTANDLLFQSTPPASGGNIESGASPHADGTVVFVYSKASGTWLTFA